MTTSTTHPLIAPPGTRCQVCGGLCGGAAVEMWTHSLCVLLTLARGQEAGKQ